MNIARTAMAAVAAALVLLAPAVASAKPKKPVPKSATFRLEINGEQLTTWSYNKVQKPACDFPETETGRQYIEFGTYDFGDTAKPKVKISRGPGDTIRYDFARDDITMTAEAEVERTYDVLYAQMTPCPGGGGPFGGDEPPRDVHGTDRCNLLGELGLALTTSVDEIEDPSYPSGLPDAKQPKAPLYFAGVPAWTFDEPSLPVACNASGQENTAIGLAESQGEYPGGIIPAGASLSAKKLLGSKKKRTTVDFSRTVKYPNEIQTYAGPPSTTGQTTMDATFTFTRLGR